MRLRYRLLTQTQLGQLFGVSSHEIGRWLVEVGLRGADKKPTDRAHRGGYCGTAPSGQIGYHWVWHAENTVAALRAAGRVLSPAPPEELIEPATLTGPFEIRPAGGRNVLNAEGEVVVRTSTERNAEAITKILNAANRHGTLTRLMATHTDGLDTDMGRQAVEPAPPRT